MQYFNHTGSDGLDIVHMKGKKDDYTITETDGALVYRSITREYTVKNMETLHFKDVDVSGFKRFNWTEEFEPFKSTLNKVDIFKDGSGVALFELNDNLNDTGGQYNMSGSASFTVGKFGKAKFSGGVVSNATLGEAIIGNATVSYWLKVSSAANDAWTNVFTFTSTNAINGGWLWGNWYKSGQNGSMHPHYNADGISISAGKVVLNDWNHIVHVQKDGVQYLYINNVMTDSVARPNMGALKNFQLGHSSWLSGTNVGVDQIRIIKKAVSVQEIDILNKEN